MMWPYIVLHNEYIFVTNKFEWTRLSWVRLITQFVQSIGIVRALKNLTIEYKKKNITNITSKYRVDYCNSDENIEQR